MKYQLYYILIAFGLLFGACTNDYDKFEAYDLPSQELIFLNSLHPVSQTTILETSTAKTIITDEKYLLEIPERAFVDDYGKEVEGNFEFRFTIYKDASSWLSNNISMVDQDAQLIGITTLFHISAVTSTGHVLKLKDGEKIRIKIPSESLPNEQLLYMPDGDVLERNLSKWKEIPMGNIFAEGWSYENELGQTINESGYIIDVEKTRWVAIGHPVQKDQGVNIETILPEMFSPQNTHVFLKGLDNNTFHLLEWNEDRHGFCDLDNKVPAGKTYRLIVVSHVNSSYFLKIADVPIYDDVEISTEPLETDLSEILESLKDI